MVGAYARDKGAARQRTAGVDSVVRGAYRSPDANNETMASNEMLEETQESAIAQDGHRRAIVIELLHEDAQPPRRATGGSAGYDLCAYLTGQTIDCSDGQRQWKETAVSSEDVARVTLPAQAMALIPLGFKARLPNGYEAQIRPRSGAAFKKGLGIPNAPGTVDSDFPDEWRVIVRNTTDRAMEIAHGERIAQMVLHRYEVLPFVAGRVAVSTERVGGFGSTGR